MKKHQQGKYFLTKACMINIYNHFIIVKNKSNNEKMRQSVLADIPNIVIDEMNKSNNSSLISSLRALEMLIKRISSIFKISLNKKSTRQIVFTI